MARPVEGPELALFGIYREYAALVWRSLRRFGVDDSQLEDAVQDVFMVIHRQINRFEGRSSLATWIYGIAARVAKDYRRSRARHVNRLEHLSVWLSSNAEPATTPFDAAERREANMLLYEILATLPGDLREVLVLVQLEELSAREAALALGIRVRTCQRRLQAANAAVSLAVGRYLEGNRRST